MEYPNTMNKTMKEIVDAAEYRWKQQKYTEGQKRSFRNWKKFVINREEPKTQVTRQLFEQRLKLDHEIDKLNEQRSLREVWDE